jgi:hypothetical protein
VSPGEAERLLTEQIAIGATLLSSLDVRPAQAEAMRDEYLRWLNTGEAVLRHVLSTSERAREFSGLHWPYGVSPLEPDLLRRGLQEGVTLLSSVRDALPIYALQHSTGQETADAQRPTGGAVRLFYSYSHKDERMHAKLETHLALLQRQGVIESWHDRKITAGQEWKDSIDQHLESADVVLLLVSADFLQSDYCYEKEMQRALARHDAGEARVIPIILRPVDWTGAPFAKLQALPKDGKAITRWKNRDEAWEDVAKGIRKAVEELVTSPRRQQRTGSPSSEFRKDDFPLSSTGFVETGFALPVRHAGIDARAERGALAKGERLLVVFQDVEQSTEGLGLWLTVENRDNKACRWFGCTLTAYAFPRYAEIKPALHAKGGHFIIDIYPGEQFTCYYFFPFTPNVHGPKFVMCKSWDKPLTFWWARGA